MGKEGVRGAGVGIERPRQYGKTTKGSNKNDEWQVSL